MTAHSETPTTLPDPIDRVPNRLSRRGLIRRGAIAGAGIAGVATVVRFGTGGSSILAQDAGTA
ncbi:MAG: hypothetical protein ACTHQE_01030, partial [Thermomicrobiales bacterium]